MTWQSISTAPRDGTFILVLINHATVWVAHIAFYVGIDDMMEPDPDMVGWWSYVRHSVTQEKLDDDKILYWQPFTEPEGYHWGIKQP